MRRGFKSQCEKRSLKIRTTLGLGSIDPLNAHNLAKHMNVTVWSANEISGVSTEDLNQLTIIDSNSWSAFTCRIESHNLVVYNPNQTEPRICLLYTSPSPRDGLLSRMPSSA